MNDSVKVEIGSELELPDGVELLTWADGTPCGSTVETFPSSAWEAYEQVRFSMPGRRPHHYYSLAKRGGEYGVVLEMSIDPDDGFTCDECLCPEAAAAALRIVGDVFADDHPDVVVNTYESSRRSSGKLAYAGIAAFMPFSTPADLILQVDRELDRCWDKVAALSFDQACWPENLRAFCGRSADFRAVTDSTGKMLDGSDPDGLGVEGRKAYGQVPFMQMGPTSVLARTPSGAYGTMSEIYMEPGPNEAFAYIDRFDDYQAFLEDGQEALWRCAARLAWRHQLPGVAVSVVEDDERGKPGTTALQVFVSAELPEERRREVLEDLDAQFGEIDAETGRVEREHGEDELGDAGLPERRAPEKSKACFGEEH